MICLPMRREFIFLSVQPKPEIQFEQINQQVTSIFSGLCLRVWLKVHPVYIAAPAKFCRYALGKSEYELRHKLIVETEYLTAYAKVRILIVEFGFLSFFLRYARSHCKCGYKSGGYSLESCNTRLDF